MPAINPSRESERVINNHTIAVRPYVDGEAQSWQAVGSQAPYTAAFHEIISFACPLAFFLLWKPPPSLFKQLATPIAVQIFCLSRHSPSRLSL
jgi:hypothetical protein